jgi:uncharacterized protein DUF4129
MSEQRDQQPPGTGSATVRLGGIAVLLVLAVVAARARAAGYLPHVASPPGALVLGLIRSIGIGVLTAGLVLLAWGRRVRLKKLAGAAPELKRKLTEEQRRRVIVAALVGTVVALLLQIVFQLLGPPAPNRQQRNGDPDAPIGEGHGWIDLAKGHQPGQAGIGTYLTGLVAVLALVALAIVLFRRSQDVVELVDEADEDEEKQAETVTRAMIAGQAAVRDEAILDARQAIVACFAAMERALAGFGAEVAPREADTPEEVLHRGVALCRLPEEPASTLLGLFREARFSTHPMGQPERDAADRALAAMLAALGARAGRVR